MDVNVELWETAPSFSELLYGVADFINYYRNSTNQQTIWTNCRLIKDHRITGNDILLIFVSAVFFTVVRHYLTSLVFQPLCKRLKLTPENEVKSPESLWRFSFYVLAWSFALYLAVYKNKFLQHPSSIWKGWNLESEIPTDTYLFLIMELGFYVHSIYSLVFLDVWRKDSIMLIFHHVLTLLMVGYGIAARCHNEAVLVLFFHDMADVPLEFTKLNIFFKIQSDNLVKFHETLSTISFVVLTVSWAISRLYWFPLKGIYAFMISPVQAGIAGNIPALSVFAFFLWLFLAMNAYWFFIILRIAIVSVKNQGPEDVREYDVDDEYFKKLRKKIKEENESASNGNVSKITSSEANGNGFPHPTKRKQVRHENQHKR